MQKGQWNKNAEQKQRNKNSGIKIGGDHWTLGNGDPKYKCKKVSGTKTVQNKKNWWRPLDMEQKEQEQKQRNKNWWGPLDIG